MITIEDLRAAGADDTLIVAVIQSAEARVALLAAKSTNANRQRRYRERKLAALRPVTETVTNVTSNVTNVTMVPDSSLPGSPYDSNNSTPSFLSSFPPHPKSEQPRARARARQISETAQPTPQDCAAAAKAGLGEEDFRKTWSHFRDHHLSKGSLMLNWEAAWRTWLAKTNQFGRNPNGIDAVPWWNRRDVGLSTEQTLALCAESQRRDDAEVERKKRTGKYAMRRSPMWGEVWELKPGETDDGTESCRENSSVIEGIFQTVQPRTALPNGRG